MWYGFQDITRDALSIRMNGQKLRPQEFWAVDDVSFELKRGETLGLIGPNGSGKTTLLKMLNGIVLPDRGRVEVQGRVGALIAVGAGFHPQLTGRENIYINGTILGMGKREIDKKFEQIVDFADIGDFLDTPVKNYSSGMFVRLGFAVAVYCEPDILLVDEVLSVGDHEFQLKCYQRMHAVRKRGTTIILVSHNEYTIREYTKKCLYLNAGKVRFLGSSEEGISVYLRDIFEKKAQTTLQVTSPKPPQSRKAEVIGLKFLDANENEVSFIESGEELNIVLECVIRERLSQPIFGVNYYNDSGFMYCANSEYENVTFDNLPLGTVKIRINIPHLYLPVSDYVCSAVIAEENATNLMDWQNKAYKFVVGRAKNSRGSVKLPTQWELMR
jgi:lipopolysaccharide transport system ATP-binding protein